MKENDYLQTLRQIDGLQVAFVARIPSVNVDAERDEVMSRLRDHHARAVAALGFSTAQWWRAEQVHGNKVAVAGHSVSIMAADGLPVIEGVDGMIASSDSGLVLAIYVADCGPIWLADTANGAFALLHSGKKGTEGNILGEAVEMMQRSFGSRPENLVGVLGPCIRPPHYEFDFAAEISRQAAAAGVGRFFDCRLCTASDLSKYYSYRKEKGRTGRMMALIGRQNKQ